MTRPAPRAASRQLALQVLYAADLARSGDAAPASAEEVFEGSPRTSTFRRVRGSSPRSWCAAWPAGAKSSMP